MNEKDWTINDIQKRKEKGEKCIFTNGCFDIVHKGHVELLKQARAMGDFLVVGLNSDESVERLKGLGRPVNDLASRKALLEAIRYVDYVIVFSEDTPVELIKKVKPFIIVKGGDYSPEKVIGSDIVEEYGGRVEIIPLVEGYSSSKSLWKVGEELEYL